MPTLEKFSHVHLKKIISAPMQRKARGYINRLSNCVRRGDTLLADADGTSRYHVEVVFSEDSVQAVCSCPYDWGGHCKHIGAVMYKWLEQPGAFAQETAVAPNRNMTAGLEVFFIDPPPSRKPQEKPAWLTSDHNERSRQYTSELKEKLEMHRVQDLRQMAQKHGWTLTGVRKDDLVSQMMNYLTAPGQLFKIISKLDQEHRAVWRAVCILGRGTEFDDGAIGTIARRWGPLTQYKKVKTYLDRLADMGLIIPPHHSYNTYTPYVAPRLMQAIINAPLADALDAVVLPQDKKSAILLASPQTFLRDAAQTLLLLERESPSLRQPMPRPRLEKFQPVLAEWDYLPEEVAAAQKEKKFGRYDPNFYLTIPAPAPPLPDEQMERFGALNGGETRFAFLYGLLEAAGLLQPGSPVTVWPENKESFWRRSETEQWATLVRAYFGMDNWSELWLALAAQKNRLTAQRSLNYYSRHKPREFYRALATMRGRILRLLACLPDEQWISLTELLALIRPFWIYFREDGFLRDNPNRNYSAGGGWRLANGERPLQTDKRELDWNMAQGSFIGAILAGPLHWLGLTDLAFDGDERLVAFRLHGLGDLFWDRAPSVPFPAGREAADMSNADAPEADAPQADLVVDDLTIIVNPSTLSAQGHHYLDQLGLLAETSPRRFVYKVDAAAVHQTFERGRTLDNLRDDWRKTLKTEMPAAIEAKLTAWWKAYGRVRLYENVTVIEFGDEYALKEMKAVTSLDKEIIAEISPSLVLIPVTAVDRLIVELEKAGYTPKQTDAV